MNNPNENAMNKVWESTVLEEMVEHLDDNEISLLVNALNDAVAEICESYDIR